MKNSLKRSFLDDAGQWWYLQPKGTRQRAKVATCATCSEEYLTYPGGSSGYCSAECYRKVCENCGSQFHPRTVRQVYCSDECKVKRATCLECGVMYALSKNAQGKFCSTECCYENKVPTGSVGDYGNGYRIVKVPRGAKGTKLGGNKRRWMLEHRWVMQQTLGRPLTKHEHVHHINGVRGDNRPENLELWKGSHPHGVRASDYHCAGCRCGETH